MKMVSIQKGVSPLFNLQEITSHLTNMNYPEKALNLIKNCGKGQNRFILASCGCGTRVVEINHSCNKRFCPICSKKRQRRLRRRLLPYLKKFPNNSLYQFRFLTISPKNYNNLHEGIKHIRRSWSKFLRRKYVKERVKGGFCILEIKKSKDNSWNVHLHAIIYSRHLDHVCRGVCSSCGQNYLKYDRFSKNFYCSNRKCNSVYEGIIKQSKIQSEFVSSSGRDCVVDISRITKQSSVINYCLKYVSVEKSDFISSYDFALYIKETYRERMINAFGDFYGISKLHLSPCICLKCRQVIKFSFISNEDLEEIKIKPPDLNSLNVFF